MARMRYARDGDIVSTLVTPTVDVGTIDTDYPIAGLTDKNPAKPAKLNEVTGTFKWDFTAAQRVDGVFIPHHNLDAALSVRLQMNATDAWGGPTVDQALTVPAYEVNGFPVGFWFDLTTATGYSAGGFQFVRLHIDGVNSANIAIGEVLLTNIVRTFPFNISWGVRFGDKSLSVRKETDWNVAAVFDRGTFIRSIRGQVDTKDADVADFRNLHLDVAQQARPIILVQDGDVNEMLYVRSDLELFEQQARFVDDNIMPLSFTEVGRGLVL